MTRGVWFRQKRGSIPRRAAATGLAVAGLGTPSLATADEMRLPVELAWRAPSACPTSHDVLALVRARVGDASPDTMSVVRAGAEIVRQAGGRFRLTLSIADDGNEGARRLEATSCEELADATALIVAMSLRPDARTPLPPSGSSALASPAPVAKKSERRDSYYARQELSQWQITASNAAPPADRVEPPPIGRRPKRAPGVDVWLGGAVQNDIGSLPLPSGGGAVVVALRVLEAVRLEAAGTYWAPQRVERAHFALLTGSVSACPTRRILDALEFSVCGAAEGGRWSAESDEELAVKDADRVWIALRTGAGFTWFVTEWGGVFARTDVSVPLVQPSFEVNEGGRVEETALAAARAFLGAEVRIR